MEIQFKKTHPNAVIPIQAKPGDACWDLVAVEVIEGSPQYTEFSIGIAFSIPEGYVGLIFPRSSISKYPHILANSVGVIDSGYRGTVTVRLKTLSDYLTHYTEPAYKIGDKIAQLLVIPRPMLTFVEVDELPTSERGKGGYGSTGL